MNRTAQFVEQSSTTRRPRLKAALGAALLAAACGAPAAQAVVIDFEGLQGTVLGHDEWFVQGGVRFSGLSYSADALPGDAVGMVVDGSDAGVCVNLACPPAQTGNYYAGINDGVLTMSAASGSGTIQVAGFDASFIGSQLGATYPSVAGFLRVQGFGANGSTLYEDFLFPGGSKGFAFQHFNTSAAFGARNFTDVSFFAFNCEASGNCSAFQTNKGQFALDNVIVSVPEPTTYLMLLLGLAGIGALARRRA